MTTHAAPMRVIRCDGLVLEPQTAAHAHDMFAVLSDPAIYQYENQPPPSPEWLLARFKRLESRRSSDGRDEWLNWVLRLPSSQLIGYVQATVHPDGRAAIAYALASAHWGRGLARRAVEAMITELAAHHGVRTLYAVLRRENQRSLGLLQRLGFESATPEALGRHPVAPDELLMERVLKPPPGPSRAA
ncbi:MAG TPA: GNAT family N-acetyltransferase [Albitalea sp.]|nr:GNAT family N-acetyltransferase [Albitalea sp.]